MCWNVTSWSNWWKCQGSHRTYLQLTFGEVYVGNSINRLCCVYYVFFKILTVTNLWSDVNSYQNSISENSSGLSKEILRAYRRQSWINLMDFDCLISLSSGIHAIASRWRRGEKYWRKLWTEASVFLCGVSYFCISPTSKKGRHQFYLISIYVNMHWTLTQSMCTVHVMIYSWPLITSKEVKLWELKSWWSQGKWHDLLVRPNSPQAN